MARQRYEESGVGNVSLAAGDGTLAIVFDMTFDFPPSVRVGFQESLGAGKRGFCSADTVTTVGFTITVDSDSALADVDVAWHASNRRPSEKCAQ